MDYDIYNIDLNDEISHINLEDNTFKLYKLNIHPEINILGYTNLVFYLNNNNTLPEGMDISSQILMNMGKNTYIKKSEDKVRYTILNGNVGYTIILNVIEFTVKKKERK